MEEIVLDSSASQRNHHINNRTAGKREREREDTYSEISESEDKPFYHQKLPLDFIVMLLETFVDDENVNFVFEYLPG